MEFLVSTATAARWTGIPASTLRNWAAEDNWRSHGTSRHRRWDWDEIVASYQRRRQGVRSSP